MSRATPPKVTLCCQMQFLAGSFQYKQKEGAQDGRLLSLKLLENYRVIATGER